MPGVVVFDVNETLPNLAALSPLQNRLGFPIPVREMS